MKEKDVLEQFQILVRMMEKMDSKIDTLDSRMGAVESRMDSMESKMATKDDLADLRVELKEYVDTRIRHTEIMIENDVVKRIDALSDGYKLNYDKNQELERRVDKQDVKIEELRVRVCI